MSFFDVWKNVLLRPSIFYSEMPKSGGYIEPFKFAFFCSSPLMLYILIDCVFRPLPIGFLIAAPISISLTLLSYLLPQSFLTLLFSYIFVRNGNKRFESIFRIISYSNVLLVIPLIGGLYSLILTIIGIREVFKVSTGRAILVSGMPSILFMLGIYEMATIIFSLYSLSMG